MGMKHDQTGFDGFVKKLAKEITPGLKKGIALGMDHIGIMATGKRMINPGGENDPVDSDKVTTRSGRLARSFLPQGGAFTPTGEREQVRKITAKGEKIVGEFGSRVPYAGVHESGAEILQTLTARQIAFFWAKWYESGKVQDKWRAAALSKTVSIKVPARPILAPAFDLSVKRIFEIFEEALKKVL